MTVRLKFATNHKQPCQWLVEYLRCTVVLVECCTRVHTCVSIDVFGFSTFLVKTYEYSEKHGICPTLISHFLVTPASSPPGNRTFKSAVSLSSEPILTYTKLRIKCLMQKFSHHEFSDINTAELAVKYWNPYFICVIVQAPFQKKWTFIFHKYF